MVEVILINTASIAFTAALVVGVVEDINNIADSFVPVDTIMLSGSDWTRQEVFFANYKGKGAHVAFMSDYALNNQLKGSFFIDDVLIEVVPKCARPKEFTFVAHNNYILTLTTYLIVLPGHPIPSSTL